MTAPVSPCDVPTIHQRLTAIAKQLRLAAAACQTISDHDAGYLLDGIGMLPGAVAEPAKDALLAALEDVFWLQQLPATMLEQPAPDDDQAGQAGLPVSWERRSAGAR
jgi:hypothetical protein